MSKTTVIFEVPDFEFKPSVDRDNQVEFDPYKGKLDHLSSQI
jgi:hypothetical protein